MDTRVPPLQTNNALFRISSMRRRKYRLSLAFILTGVLLALLGLSARHSAYAGAAAPRAFFVAPDGTGTACTQPAPCTLATALGLAADGDTIYLAQGTYTGQGAAVITLTQSITLAGGWDRAPTGPVKRAPEAYPTVLDGERQRRVVYVDRNVAAILDGLVIARGNATGLTLDRCTTYKPDGCGGGVLAAPGSRLTVRRSVITDNVAAVTTQGLPTGTTGYGGGIALMGVASARIEDSLIISNAASLAANGMGGGLYLSGGRSAADIQVTANRILSNTATTQRVASWGGGIAVDDAVTIGKNWIAHNRASEGAGLHTWFDAWGGRSFIVDNLFTGNQGGDAVYLGGSATHLAGNRILRNATGAGLFVVYGKDIAPVIVNNVIAHSGERAVVASGSNRYPLTLFLVHNTLVGEGRGEGIYVGGYAGSVVTLTITNTIVTGFRVGITSEVPASSTIVADHVLFWANDDDGVRGTNPVDGDPRFLYPAGDDYRLRAGSAAIDAGVDAGVAVDFEGDPRPRGSAPDIGADEYNLQAIYLPDVKR